MASPQKENGFTAISNELLEAMLVASIPARHKDVWWFVVRKTYGFHKKQDRISITQFQKGTRIDRSGVCRILKDLVAWRLLGKKQGIYWVIKDYEKWVVAWRPLSLVACTPPTKETITKDNILAKAKNMKKIDPRKFDSDYELVIDVNGDKVETPFVREEKEKARLVAETSRVIDEFNRLYIKKIGDELPKGSITFIRKIVKDALKLYSADEIISFMPQYFKEEFYRPQAWAIWTMMSTKVLNQLKNGKH